MFELFLTNILQLESVKHHYEPRRFEFVRSTEGINDCLGLEFSTKDFNFVTRFIAVTQPIKYTKHRSSTRVWLTIVFLWVFSGLVGSPIVLGLSTPPEPVYATLCTFHNYYFIFFSQICSLYIPFIFLLRSEHQLFMGMSPSSSSSVRPPPPSVLLLRPHQSTTVYIYLLVWDSDPNYPLNVYL